MSAQVWDDIQKAYDVEFDHHQKMTGLGIETAQATAMLFQSQMLGLILLGEAEHGSVVMDDSEPPTPAPSPPPTESPPEAPPAAPVNPTTAPVSA